MSENLLKEAQEYFADDAFAAAQGIQIKEVKEGGAVVCTMQLLPGHCNSLGMVQGGAVFTLGDFAFAVAAYTSVPGTVTTQADIRFLHPAKGQRLTATARLMQKGRRLCAGQVDITDELGTLVAVVTASGYATGRQKPPKGGE